MATVKGQSSFASDPKDHDVSLTVLTGTVAALGTVTLPGVRLSGDLKFSTVSTAETISVTASHDGVNFEAALKPFDLSTGLDHATGNLATGNYVIPYRVHSAFKAFKFTKSAAVNTGFVAVAAPVQVP